MRDKRPMEDSELVAFLARKLEDALNDEDGDISEVRQENLDYYLGEPYGDERDGYSSIVTRECLEAIEWALPSIMRVFTSGDKVVVFDPVGPEDEDQAEQETDVINYHILKKNDGFMLFYTWFKDALMFPNGYAKCWVDESENTTTEEYNGLNEFELSQLLSQEGVEPVEHESVTAMTASGMEEVHSVRIRRTETKRRLIVEPVPPEQVAVDKDLACLNLDKGDFNAHRVKRNFTWLVNNGYDPDELEEAYGESREWNDERVNRMFYDEESPDIDDDDDSSMREFWVSECFVKVDYDGDGLAEMRKVVLIGAKIFENEELDYQPLVALSSVPMQHKHTGLSLLEMVKDLQRIQSTLTRLLLDNLYRIGIRRKYVGESALLEDGSTISALMDTAAELIPCRDETRIKEEVIQSVVPEIQPVIQSLRDQQQTRTGIAPNLSLDPNVLQQATMGAFTNALAQASQRIEMITRIFAETGVKQLMRKAHQQLRQHMDKPEAIKLRGKWVNVNPSEWRERDDISANVGLGFNNKDQLVQMLMGLLNLQKEALGAGLADREKIYNTLERLVEASGLGSAERYFNNPAMTPPPQPQQDPLEKIAQMEAMLKRQELQLKEQKQQMDMMAKVADLDLKRREQARKERQTEADIADMEASHVETLTEFELEHNRNIPGSAV